MQQMNFLRDIHVTAQQSLTEDRNELLQQASNIIKNVRELQQLTESVQARQAGSQQSPLEHDSGRETKKKGKKSRKTGPQHNESKGSNAGRSGRIQPRFTGLTFEPNLHTGLGLFFNNTTSRQRDHPNHATGPRLHSSSRSFPVNSLSPAPLELSYQQTNKYSQSYQPLPFSPLPGSPVHSYDASWSPPISPFTSTVGTFHSSSLHNMPATPTYKSDICRAYWIHGNCQYGTRCFFLHTPPLAHGSVSKATVACLEDPSWGIHLQVYQDHHNVENLKSMLHAGVDIASSTALSAEPSITALLSQVNGASLGFNYGVMPMPGVTMVPMYPLKPAPASSISSTSLGHFIRIPFTSATQALSLRAHSSQVQVYGGHVQQRESVGIIQPKKPVQKTSKTPKQPSTDMNVRRFSTAGPLQSRKQNTYDPSIGSKVNKAYTKGSSNQANVIKRPASRSVRHVGRTILQESSIEGTRLAVSGPKANGPRIADVMGQVESRLSKRMA
ncbi:hypothetical protein QFC21_001285 [Naganishia friedmannii]|uniref:Uncharacterized protein n=1 Tax=Naganishia friedmannii TaxID=89922 RepID=A0ACC2W413_9TREE|nr:hypothetical protein QFC21_001285 [Naganishia friedmannii]